MIEISRPVLPEEESAAPPRRESAGSPAPVLNGVRPGHRMAPVWAWLLILALLGVASPGATADAAEGQPDLGSMSLSELMQLEVTSVSRQPEELLGAAAVISVLTREEIRRSGCTTLPDLLRLVPGVRVGQASASLWSVSVRGFAGRFSAELLVLVDGRSVYTPLFSGVWEAGYRSQPTEALLLDATVFLMKHDRAGGFDIGDTSFVMSPSPHVSIPLILNNSQTGEARGIELASDWYPRPWLRLRAAYSYLNLRQTGGGTVDDGVAGGSGSLTDVWNASPAHQAWLWASLDLNRSWDLDLSGRYVSAIRAQEVRAYNVLDARLAWRPSPPLEISLAGRNLGPASHEEFNAEFSPTTAAIKPAVYMSVALSW